MPGNETLGWRVRRLRQERKLSQVQLAKEAGCSQGTISDLERNRYPEQLGSTLVGVARALRTTGLYLRTGDDRYRWPESVDEREAILLEIDRNLTPENQAALLGAAKGLLATQPKGPNRRQ
jgi:transcriptional regulator with XRE-family HTH domain